MIVTAVIFGNCITLCLFNPRQPEHAGMNGRIFWAELAFNICFTLEMILRIISMGSVWAYIRRPWNQFDAFMVVAGYTVFVPGNSSAVNAIRALRALRPLRTITRFESLRGVIVCFLETCLDPVGKAFNGAEDPDMQGCGGSGYCPANHTCTLLDEPRTVNVAGFDNTALAMLSVWQALTLTGWVFMMYRTVDAYSLVATAYYVTLVFIGAYFVLNLFLAVLKIKFAKAQTLFHNQLALQRKKARRNSIAAFMSKVHSKWTEYSSKRSKSSLLNSRLSSAISSRMSTGSLRLSGPQLDLGAPGSPGTDVSVPAKDRDADCGHWQRSDGVKHHSATGSAANDVQGAAGPADQNGSVQARTGIPPETAPEPRDALPVSSTSSKQEAEPGRAPAQPALSSPGTAAGRSLLRMATQGSNAGIHKGARSMRAVSFKRRDDVYDLHSPRVGTGASNDAAAEPPLERMYSAAPSSMGNTNVAMIVMTTAEFDEFVADHPYWERQLLRLQYRTRMLVNHNLFNQFFMLLIFVNTVLLALEYDNQPDSLTYFLNISNYVLTALFTTEMALKLFGLGFWDYIRDGFNIFDALVVTISLLEIILSSMGGANAARALRVLKALRVLRLFKLFRYMQSLRRIGEVLLSAFTSFAAIATLLMLFWIVFSIIGMHVFGAKDLDVYPWPDFSTFLYSLIATWNVLNLENWQNTMYATIRQTDYGSSLFFIFWIIIGRYIFLTLFLAVTLEAFEAKYDPNAVRMGARGGGLTSILGSVVGKTSSFRSSFGSLRSSFQGSFSRASSNARGVRPIGYFEDVKAAAAAQYGDDEAPRVNIRKMYTIRQWIDTGNMDVLRAETPDPLPVRWQDGALRSQTSTLEGTGPVGSETRLSRGPLLSIDGRPSAPRAGQGMDDSAAQSLASSDAAPRSLLINGPRSPAPNGGSPRPIAEGQELGSGPGTPSPDPATASQAVGPFGLVHDDPGRRFGHVPDAAPGRSSPGPILQSLSREVRRSIQGFVSPADDANVDDAIASGVKKSSANGMQMPGTGSEMLLAHLPHTAGLIRNPSLVRSHANGGLILSRVHGRSVRIGAPPSEVASATCGPVEVAPPLQVWTANPNAGVDDPYEDPKDDTVRGNGNDDDMALMGAPFIGQGPAPAAVLYVRTSKAISSDGGPSPVKHSNSASSDFLASFMDPMRLATAPLQGVPEPIRQSDGQISMATFHDMLQPSPSAPARENGIGQQPELQKGDNAKAAPELSLQPAFTGAIRGETATGAAGTRADKAPLPNILETGSDNLSRANSFDSRASGASRTSGSGADGSGAENSAQEHKKRYHKRRRVSILIEGTGKSFWIWDEDHPTREKAYRLVTDKRFEYLMFGLILLNCMAMAMENPYITPGSSMEKALVWSNVGFTALFSVEALLKMFAYTFVAYIKRITNQVDFLIVVTSLLEIILMTVSSSVGVVSALRVLRAIKPLRLLTRSAGMRLVFKSVTMSLMSMANVSIVCILFFLIFAILGVQLFAGRFYRCNDNSVSGKAECVGNFTSPITHTTIPRTWTNDFPNFDNTGNALLCCFITATLNGYTEIMVNAMSSPVEKDFQPRQFQQPGAFFWFFGFIVVVAFTLINLYVGVIFSQFSKIRMLSETGSAFLTSEQNEWAELTKMVFRLKPPDKAQLPTGRLRRSVHHMAHSRSFEYFILAIIAINAGFLAATWYGEPAKYTYQKEVANIVFTVLFGVEAVAKIFALGWAAYFKNAWNKFDFAVLVLGVLDLVLSLLHSNILRILRIFRIQKLLALIRLARFVKVVRSIKGIQSLFTTLIYSLPAFGNVGALIGLFFFMYAYVGTFLFGKVQYGNSLSHDVNFHNFFQTLLVLLRVATGDNWTGVMFDCMVQPPKCDRSSGGCGSYLAIPYFLTFVLLISVILLNLFTAVIIETFEKTHEQEEWKLSPEASCRAATYSIATHLGALSALDNFVTLWSEYDDGSGTILPRHLEELLLRLDPPLGLGPYADNKDVLRFVYDLDIPLVNARVPFHKTAFELVKRCSQATMPEGAIKEQIERLVDKFFHGLAEQEEMLNFSVAVTVMKVQRKWRTRMRAAKLMRKKHWRQDRRIVPSYQEVVGGKAGIAERFDAYKDAQREIGKAWEAKQLAWGRKPDKSELARQSEPRWRFNTKYAPPALVQATSGKTGILQLGKRAMGMNRLRAGGLFEAPAQQGGGDVLLRRPVRPRSAIGSLQA
ncbi:hypothetical protein GPECTOR_34g724 [Gonium pectorale]|uniref:Ion transport domain-containing protein n=1 Tax=Gonium pectorale TaxID=33097 RepID=A0A150GDA3_GONPE|nr:hypothetical protein GPECTOR_34g724 [Gonium pectorale]|eukprot:KXZ47565.1 hypothetical protein GPECTOR_34g724 [Gonium pectorale]